MSSLTVGSFCQSDRCMVKCTANISLGLRMNDDVIRIAAGLHLGCHPHQCHHCKATVDELGSHGLSCSKNEGHLPRHAGINIIQRSLMVARIPSI